MLAYISSEIHKGLKPFFAGGGESEKTAAGQAISKRLAFLPERMTADYLFGAQFTVADAYLFVMLTWTQKTGVPIPEPLPAYFERVKARPAVKLARRHEQELRAGPRFLTPPFSGHSVGDS